MASEPPKYLELKKGGRGLTEKVRSLRFLWVEVEINRVGAGGGTRGLESSLDMDSAVVGGSEVADG